MGIIKKNIKTYVPILDTLSEYSISAFKGDLNAGITVGIMLIPQGMAYAILAGLPPVYGLYASIIPLFIYAIFGTSRQLAVGPVAMVSLLVVAGVGELAEVGSERFIQLAILTALGVGVVQFLMGVFRMGFLVNFLSHPVLSGFTSAAAIIIGASQVKNLTGLDIQRTNQVNEIVIELFRQVTAIEPFTVSIGIGAIVMMVAIKRWKRTFPSALIVVVIGTLLTYVFDLSQNGVVVVGDIPVGLPSFSTDFFNYNDVGPLISIILVISLVSYMESIAVAKAIANKHGYKIDPNQELVALGGSNIIGSLFQSFPVTGGFSRTAVNNQSGANTTVATIISALLIAITVLFLTPLFYYLPSAVLAAIIMVAVAGLFDAQEMVHLWKTDKRDLVMLITTFAATLILGIEEGIGIGVLLSLIIVIYSSTNPHSTELGRLGDTDNFRNINRYKEAIIDDEILIYRFDASLYFANVEHFREKIEILIQQRDKQLNVVILDASAINYVDSTGVHALEELMKDLNDKNLKLLIAGAIGPVRDKLKRTGMIQRIGEECFFFDIDDAVTFQKKLEKDTFYKEFSPLQTNL